MRRNFFSTLAVCFLVGLAPTLLVRCGGQTDLGTETGNPPGIDSLKLSLAQDENGVRVVGRPGAITPAGARVTVRNLSTGQSIEASASADGSLNVLIAGAPSDEYEVTVSSGSQEVIRPVSFVQSEPDVGTLSCDMAEASLSQILGQTLGNASTSCLVDADCVETFWGAGAGCYQGCGSVIASRTGLEGAQAAARAATDPVCAVLADCERPPPPPCDPGQFQVLECREGQCQGRDSSTFSCDSLIERASQHYTELLGAADRTCAVDADCRKIATPPACLFCENWLAVSQSAATKLPELVSDEVDQGYCQALSDRSCSLPVLNCPADVPSDALCVAGTCTLVAPPEPG